MHEARSEPAAGAVSGASMDRAIRRRSPWLRRALIAAAVLVPVTVAVVLLRPPAGRSLSVAGARITTAKVVRGQFDDVIQVRGQVTPLRTTFVDTASGGQVEAIAVEDGARVERGQLLVELANTGLQL